MSKPTCNICHGQLPDYVTGKLDEVAADALRRHLESAPACAVEAERLRSFLADILPPTCESAPLPDPGAFLVGVNEGIDRRRNAVLPSWLPRPAVAVPVLAAMLLVVAGLAYLTLPISPADGDALFPDVLASEDLTGIDTGTDILSVLRDVTVADFASAGEPVVGDDVAEAAYPELANEIDRTLLGDLPYSSVMDASLDYITPFDAVETLDAASFDEIVTTLENNRITLL